MIEGIARRGNAILQRLPADKLVVAAEVGVWDGRLSKYLLRNRPDLTLYMVDRWAPPTEGSSYAASGARLAAKTQLDYNVALVNATGRVRNFGKRAIVAQGESGAIAASMASAVLDFAFIDGDHSLAGVSADIRAWWPKVKLDGWLCGHDWGKREDVWGVRAAVGSFVNRHELTLELDEDSTWFVRKPGH